MSEKYILLSAITLIVLVVFVLLISIAKKTKKTTIITTKKQTRKTRNKRKVTIKDMIEIALKRSSTNEDLKKAIDVVKNDFKFPQKSNYKLPKDIKTYLNFVLLVSSHKNADAKLIAYMDKELKKANPHYLTEIDIYENEGFKERVNRL